MRPVQRSGMGFAVGERERAAPRAAEHQPAFDAEMRAQRLDVGDEMRRGVVAQFAQGRGAPGAALVENHDAVMRGIEEAPVSRRGAGAGTAVEKQHRRPARITRLLPVHAVHAVEIEHAGVVGFDFRIKPGADCRGDVSHSCMPMRKQARP